MSEQKEHKRYKAFDSDLTCRGYQYEVGNTYSIKGELEMCKNGFHSCENMLNCLTYYDFGRSRFCEVEVKGDIITEGDKTVSSQITIIREIKDAELYEKLTGRMKDFLGECWYKNGILHRDGDLPACIGVKGSKGWWKHGKQHRDGDKPAQIWAGGQKEWHKDGELHRDGDKPAFISEIFETKKWYKNGKLHRDGNKPAVSGDFMRDPEWWENGVRIK